MTQAVPHSANGVPRRKQLLSCAEASPAIAARHDKKAWLALYAEGARVEDPVGTPVSQKGRRPGRLGDELGRFYEAFIAPSAIEVRPTKDIVSDHHVFRAVHIHTTNLKTGLEMRIPANLLYEVVFERGQPRIASMNAHWEVNRMSRALVQQGVKGVATIAYMNYRMLWAFGPRWLANYFQGSQRGVGRKGKAVIKELADAAHNRAGAALFSSSAIVELPGGRRTSPQPFLEGCTSLEPGDLIASGSTVSGLARLEWGGRNRDAALIADLDLDSKAITKLRLFWEH